MPAPAGVPIKRDSNGVLEMTNNVFFFLTLQLIFYLTFILGVQI